MLARCDGTDENLTRQVRTEDFDPASMTQSRAWAMMARPGFIVVNCQCGLVFDDEDRARVYPHEFIGQGALPGL
jgi:hypothetical protein